MLGESYIAIVEIENNHKNLFVTVIISMTFTVSSEHWILSILEILEMLKVDANIERLGQTLHKSTETRYFLKCLISDMYVDND